MPDSLGTLLPLWLSYADSSWQLATLSHDPLFHRLSPQQHRQLIAHAHRWGTRLAHTLHPVDQPPPSPHQLAHSLGIGVSARPAEDFNPNYLLLATSTQQQIWYCPVLLEKLHTAIHRHPAAGVLEDAAPLSVLVAHELFHLLVAEQQPPPALAQQITTRRWFRRRASPYMAEEIAAAAFAKALLNLPYHPRVIELLAVWCIRPPQALALTRQLLQHSSPLG